jgi:hypothetical protein
MEWLSGGDVMARMMMGADTSHAARQFKPRPVKVVVIVLRAVMTLTSEVARRKDSQVWRWRLRRLAQESLIYRVTRHVKHWEEYAAQTLEWDDPYEQDNVGVGMTEKMPGGWTLRSGVIVGVADATAAMLYSVHGGGVKGDYAVFVQAYCETFKKKLPIKAYTEIDRKTVFTYRQHLQTSFSKASNTNKYLQKEVGALAYDMGRRKGEGIKLDAYANAVNAKDKYVQVQLKQSQLTSEAAIAGRSLFVFKQLGKLYHSVSTVIAAGKQLEQAVETARQQSKEAREAMEAEMGTTLSSASQARRGALSNDAREQMLSQKSSPKKAASKQTGNSSGIGKLDEDWEYEPQEQLDELLPSSMLKQSPKARQKGKKKGVDLVGLAASLDAVESLSARLLMIRGAVSSLGKGPQFDQLIKLVDDSGAKLTKLVSEAKTTEENITRLHSNLVGEINPHIAKWVEETAALGELSREHVEEAANAELSELNTDEHAQLKRKVNMLNKQITERSRITDSEKILQNQLNEEQGLEPAHTDIDATCLDEQLASQGVSSEFLRETNKAKLLSTPTHDFSASSGKSRKSIAFAPPSFAKTPEQFLTQFKGIVKNAVSVNDDVIFSIPKADFSEELRQYASEYEACTEKLTTFGGATISNDSVQDIEKAIRPWTKAGMKVSGAMGLITDKLDFDNVPQALVDEAIQDHKDNELLKGPEKSANIAGLLLPKQGERVRKLKLSHEKFQDQAREQKDKNAKHKAWIVQRRNMVAEADLLLEKSMQHLEEQAGSKAKDEDGLLDEDDSQHSVPFNNTYTDGCALGADVRRASAIKVKAQDKNEAPNADRRKSRANLGSAVVVPYVVESEGAVEDAQKEASLLPTVAEAEGDKKNEKNEAGTVEKNEIEVRQPSKEEEKPKPTAQEAKVRERLMGEILHKRTLRENLLKHIGLLEEQIARLEKGAGAKRDEATPPGSPKMGPGSPKTDKATDGQKKGKRQTRGSAELRVPPQPEVSAQGPLQSVSERSERSDEGVEISRQSQKDMKSTASLLDSAATPGAAELRASAPCPAAPIVAASGAVTPGDVVTARQTGAAPAAGGADDTPETGGASGGGSKASRRGKRTSTATLSDAKEGAPTKWPGTATEPASDPEGVSASGATGVASRKTQRRQSNAVKMEPADCGAASGTADSAKPRRATIDENCELPADTDGAAATDRKSPTSSSRSAAGQKALSKAAKRGSAVSGMRGGKRKSEAAHSAPGDDTGSTTLASDAREGSCGTAGGLDKKPGSAGKLDKKPGSARKALRKPSLRTMNMTIDAPDDLSSDEDDDSGSADSTDGSGSASAMTDKRPKRAPAAPEEEVPLEPLIEIKFIDAHLHIFASDPPDYAKSKWNFCQAHSLDPKKPLRSEESE